MTSESDLFYEDKLDQQRAAARSMLPWDILVRYRTNSGCNAKVVTVYAATVDNAFRIASEKVGGMRGVIKVDGGEWVNPTPFMPDEVKP